MSLAPHLEDKLLSCTRCGSCLEACPSFAYTGDESLSARGRVRLITALVEGELGLTDGLAERLSLCLGCMACARACPSGVDPPALIAAIKARLVEEKQSGRLARTLCRSLAEAGGSPPALRKIGGLLETAYRRAPLGRCLPFYQEGARRLLPQPAPLSRRLPRLSPARAHSVSHARGAAAARVVFYPGCANDEFFPDAGLAAVAALNRAGADVITPPDLGCCGMPLRSLGDEATASRMLMSNVPILAGIDADAIVTVCPSCALALREHLPRISGHDPEARLVASRVMDVHEFLVDSGNRLAELAPAPWLAGAGVTWHDPCHLRHAGLTAQPREIIAALPGVRYVETPGGPSCCGGGGAFSLLHYRLALKIGLGRAEKIAASGARIVATGCPACRIHLTDVLARAGVPARVVHTMELIDPGAADL